MSNGKIHTHNCGRTGPSTVKTASCSLTCGCWCHIPAPKELTDTERIDKIERMAKAAHSAFDSVSFRVDPDGELSVDSNDDVWPMQKGWHATVREAIDAA